MHVERRRDVFRSVLLDKLDEHGGKAVDRADGFAARRGHARHRVKGAIGEGISVDYDKAVFFHKTIIHLLRANYKVFAQLTRDTPCGANNKYTHKT